MPELTRFTVVREVFPEPPGTLAAEVVFRAQVTRGVALQADLPGEIIELLLRPVTARIEQGVLVRNNVAGVRLISAAEIAIDGGFQYLAEFSAVTVNERPLANGLSPLIFDALDHDGVYDLRDAAFLTVDRAEPRARGAQGWNIDGLRVNDDNEFVFHRADGVELNPVSSDSSDFLPTAQGRAIALAFALGNIK